MDKTNRNQMDLLRSLGITGYSLETAIKVGPLFVRARELQTHLGRYAQRFVNFTGDDTYQFQHLGTATGLRYRGRFFVVSTEHQRIIGEHGNLGIFCDPGLSVITPSTMWIVNLTDGPDREDNLDFAVFEFRPEDYPQPYLQSQFFEIQTDSGVGTEVGKIALVLGYPTSLQNVDYYQGNVDLLVVSSFVKLEGPTSTDEVFLFQTQADDRFFEDGMSGTPIFEVVRRSGQFQVRWLGMVVRGGARSRYGRVISGNHILREIDKILV